MGQFLLFQKCQRVGSPIFVPVTQMRSLPRLLEQFPAVPVSLLTTDTAHWISAQEVLMVSGHADSPHPSNHALQILSTLASLTVGALFFALWFWLLPNWLGFQSDMDHIPRWRWLAAVPSILGFAVALRCVWDFGWTGRGTPAPFVPPQKLVVVGFYRYVRNPMYIGFFTGWIGLWILFGRASRSSLIVAVTATIAVVLFVRLYEEPNLRRLFGADYDLYRRNVRRWLPRLHPWPQ